MSEFAGPVLECCLWDYDEMWTGDAFEMLEISKEGDSLEGFAKTREGMSTMTRKSPGGERTPSRLLRFHLNRSDAETPSS
jgi:hypothetical protein